MKFNFLRLALLLLAVTLAPACTTLSALNQEASQEQNPSPIFLWEVSNPDEPDQTPFYLYGTVHVSEKKDAYLDKSVLRTLDAVDSLYVEVEKSEMVSPEFLKYVREITVIDDGSSIKDFVSSATYKKYVNVLDKAQVKPEMKRVLLHMRPWAAALTLAQMGLSGGGQVSDFGAETQLEVFAKKHSKTLAGLETARSQMEVLSSGNRQKQENDLLEGIHYVEGLINKPLNAAEKSNDSETAKSVARLLKLYRDGNLEGMDQYVLELSKSDAKTFDYEGVLRRRNKKLSKKIQQLMRKDVSGVAAVGVLHFAGPDSILELLREEGYVVERIDPAGRTKKIYSNADLEKSPVSRDTKKAKVAGAI